MKIRAMSIAGLLAAVAFAVPAQADSLVGADRFLCTAVEATVCDLDDGCVSGPPWNWNIPQFMEVDLNAKALGTTKASGENRSTPINHVIRDDGLIFLQGVEGGRAFSWVIVEATGELSVAVAFEGATVAVFGACTPLTSAKENK